MGWLDEEQKAGLWGLSKTGVICGTMELNFSGSGG
jgi:hypothetical protein